MKIYKVKVSKVPDRERRRPSKKMIQFKFIIEDLDVQREYDPSQSTTLILQTKDGGLAVGIMKTVEAYEVQRDDDKVYFEVDQNIKMDENELYDITFISNDSTLSHGYDAIKNIKKYDLEEYFRDFDKEPASLDQVSQAEVARQSGQDNVYPIEVISNVPCSSNNVIEISSNSSSSSNTSYDDSYNQFTSNLEPDSSESGFASGAETYQKIAMLYSIPPISKKVFFNWMNKSIGDNQEQMVAVQNIVNATARPFPYVVFGPPGEFLKFKFQNNLLIDMFINGRNWKDNSAR
jgi:hypothetical protein